MLQGFTFRIGHPGAKPHTFNKRTPQAAAACATGGFYKQPTSGQVVNATQPLTISWDSSCLDTSVADIYLYAPSNSRSLIQMFKDVDFKQGTFTTNLKPQWWNRTTSVDLQLAVVQSGTEPFMATLPAGPIWKAAYTPGSDSSSDSPFSSNATMTGVTEVNNLASNGKGGVSKGGIAAAVLVPIIVLGIALALYMRFVRKREQRSRKRWSEAVDRRMSTISTDWRSLGHAGAEAAIRASIYANGNRVSFAGSQTGTPQQDMAQIRRPGVGLRGGAAADGDRVSRVSFAVDTRFSRASVGEGGARPRPNGGRTGVPSRAFHSGYIPSMDDKFIAEEGQEERAISPRQKDGPVPLSAAAIQEHVNGIQIGSNGDGLTVNSPSMDRDSVVMPALAMMRENNGSQADLILQPTATVSPFQPNFSSATTVAAANMRADLRSPPPVAPRSPVTEALVMQPMHAGVLMNPDDMLKIYAERRRTGASTGTSSSMGTLGAMPAISFPMPVASSVSTTTSTSRTLYSPSAGTGDVQRNNGSYVDGHAHTKSAETYYANEDAYAE